MALKVFLDDLDKKIILALEEHGAKTSTRELSEILNESDRTIRYRLAKLKDQEMYVHMRGNLVLQNIFLL